MLYNFQTCKRCEEHTIPQKEYIAKLPVKLLDLSFREAFGVVGRLIIRRSDIANVTTRHKRIIGFHRHQVRHLILLLL